MTSEDIKKANSIIEAIDFKGKNYAPVNERIKAFRDICPNGSIETEIIALDAGVVTMKTTVRNEEGGIISTGMAQEKETSSYVNKTSFIENCETSAVGRALGFAGIGVDGSIASADELANALNNQGTPKVEAPKNDDPNRKLNNDEIIRLKRFCKKENIPEESIYSYFKKKKLGDMTKKDWDIYYKDYENIIASWRKAHEGEA